MVGNPLRLGGNQMMRKALVATVGLAAFLLSLSAATAQDRKVISTPNAPEAIGPYSQAIRAGKTVYLAGQIAIDPKTKQVMANAPIEDQTRLVLENLKAVLAADGLGLEHIVATTVFLKDLNEFGKMNEVYATFLRALHPRVQPSRSRACRAT
jgi:2-iminobutanoate/2-iminopropanoate deaminase